MRVNNKKARNNVLIRKTYILSIEHRINIKLNDFDNIIRNNIPQRWNILKTLNLK